jgi:hypothetical protein
MKTVNFICTLAGADTQISHPIEFPFSCENNEITELAHRIVGENAKGFQILDLDNGKLDTPSTLLISTYDLNSPP